MALQPLGRIIEHDPRSRAYPFKAAKATTYTSVTHTNHIGVLDQGDIGSCTGNATVAALGSDPFFATLPGRTLDEDLAVSLYSLATSLDDYTGAYPPTDTGTSGLAIAKAAQQRGYVSGYTHAFTVGDALGALMSAPVLVGITWLDTFDEPAADGLVKITRSSQVRGGHEICADGYDADKGRVWFRNSWGASWGVQGRFSLSLADWTTLLRQDGDVTVLSPLSAPAPAPVDPITPPSPQEIVDRDLIDAMSPWRATKADVPSTKSAAGRAARGYDVWKSAKGL